MSRTIAIADVHGCLDKLNRLLELAAPEPGRDRLIFVGDMIDRGPDSPGVIDRILELTDSGLETICLRGNHELMLVDYLTGRLEGRFYRANGGASTLSAYRHYGYNLPEDELPARHIQFLAGLEPYHIQGEYLFVHAGLRPGIPLADQRPDDLYWIRDEFFSQEVDWGYKIVFGHTPFERPFTDNGLFGIDTGAVYGGGLTALILPDEEFIRV